MSDVTGGPDGGYGPALSATAYCEQLPETSFTEDTRSCCALLSPIAAPGAPPAALAFCTVPLTSTFLPTSDARSLEPPLSLYVVAEPLVAVGLGLSVGLAGFAAAPEADASRMKPAEAELAGLAGAPGAALGDEASAFRHPVTVIVCGALLLFASC